MNASCKFPAPDAKSAIKMQKMNSIMKFYIDKLQKPLYNDVVLDVETPKNATILNSGV